MDEYKWDKDKQRMRFILHMPENIRGLIIR